jgi:hypothetical protein
MPKNCALLGGNENAFKIKDDSKIKQQTNLHRHRRDLYRMYATFLTPLGSHYRLPLKGVHYYQTSCKLFFLGAARYGSFREDLNAA